MAAVIGKAAIACLSEGALSLLTQFGFDGQGASLPLVRPGAEPVSEYMPIPKNATNTTVINTINPSNALFTEMPLLSYTGY